MVAGLGIIFTTLGFAGLLLLPLISITSVAVFGAFMAVAGALQAWQGFTKTKNWKSRRLHILMGLVYVIGGMVTLENPVLATTVFTIILGVALITVGTIRIAVAFQNKDVNRWALMTLSGFLTILLGLIIVLQWPWSSLWAVGLFVSIDLMISGASFIAIALTAKTSKNPSAEPVTG
ncbi:HdeD family acid-resistance protein [Thermococcus celer]|uniref:HdeD family acid-resistance protein n=1 Tax=Thermococcus celer TaxID=2264 RepID=UPI001F247AF0|nr:DUF308 domain-containing protein [Thermococcus celer]